MPGSGSSIRISRRKPPGRRRSIPSNSLDRIFQSISEVQKALARNVNRQLALETLMLEIKKKKDAGAKGQRAANNILNSGF